MSVAAPTVRDFWDATDFAQRVLPLPSPVPWIEGAAAVELRSGEDVLARMPTHAAPAIEVDFPSPAQLEQGRGNVSYKVRTKNKRIAVAVRASVDGGGTWTAVVARKREGTVDVSALPAEAGSTEFGLLEVLATSGYHTASKRSESFRIPARARPILAWSSAEASGGRVGRAESVKLYASRPTQRRCPASCHGRRICRASSATAPG